MLDKARAWIAAEPATAGAALGPAGLPDPRRHAVDARKLAAMLPAFPANLRKQLKGAPMPAPRNILAAAVEGTQVDFDTALRIEGRYFVELVVRAGLEEHDQGVLLRPQRDQRRRLAAGRVREVHAAQGRRARRRDDGRGHRLRVRAVGLGGRAQGRHAGGRGEGQGLLRGPGREGRQARAHHRREGRGAAGADHPDRRLQRPRGLRPRHRGRVRVGRAQAGGVPRGDEGDRAGRAAVLQHLHAADHRAGRAASTARRDFIGLHFFSPVDKMPLVEIIRGERTSDAALAKAFDVAHGDAARPRSSSTTAAASSPAA